jgi:hypothetical protein
MNNENQITEQIKFALHDLTNAAENNPKGFNINSAIAEINVNGINYQIQVQFVADKQIWCDEYGIKFSEIVRIHK